MDGAADLEAIERVLREKVAAELHEADAVLPGADAIRSSGDLLATVALVKGEPGPRDTAIGSVLAGPDGEAAARALAALGFADPAFALCSRPVAGADTASVARRLRLALEAVDPRVIVALDAAAAEDVASALGAESLEAGVPVHVAGRVVLALGGFEASLGDERAKRRVWRQLKPLGAYADAHPLGGRADEKGRRSAPDRDSV